MQYRKRFYGQKLAFTLAEILITLGIIGVIAAMSVPMLITSTQKIITSKKVARFYSITNNAVKLSTSENGSLAENPDVPLSGAQYKDIYAYIQKYYMPYLNLLSCKGFKHKKVSGGGQYSAAACTMVDGNIMVVSPAGYNNSVGSRIFITLVTDERCLKEDVWYHPRCAFVFSLNNFYTESTGTYNKVGNQEEYIIPYQEEWDGKYESLYKKGTKYSCSQKYSKYPNYCAKYIQESGWKIPHNYPWL